jgi:hypothetical protein
MNVDIEQIKLLCKQSNLWEIDNPRVVAMLHNIIQCIEAEDLFSKEVKETAINTVLSNLIIFGKYKIS